MFSLALFCLCFLHEFSTGTGCVQVTVNSNGDGNTCNGGDGKSESKVVAFHALMSKHGQASEGQTIIFDTVKTNVGNGYSASTGVFTAPRSGVYVFTYVIRLHKAERSTEIMVNDNVQGATFYRASGTDDGSVSGSLVIHITQGDRVYVRNHSKYAGTGTYNSNIHGQPTFSGWILG